MSNVTTKLDAPQPDADTDAPRGLRGPPGTPNRLVAWSRGWARRHMNREKVVAFLKNILWVAPLTVLIWIYAERQQEDTRPQVTLPVEVISSDPTKVVRIVNPSDKNVVLTLKGPRAALDRLAEQINPASGSPPLQIPLNDTAAEGTQTVDSLRVGEDKRLVDAGITVVSVSPRKLEIQVDPIISVEAVVVGDESLLNPPTFTPARVTLRGPRSVLKPDQQNGKPLEVTAAIAGRLSGATPTTSAVTLNNVKLSTRFRDPNVSLTPAEVSAVVELDRPAEDKIPTVRIANVSAPSELLKNFDVVLPNDFLYDVPITGRDEYVRKLAATNPGRLPEAGIRLPRDANGPGEVEADVIFTIEENGMIFTFEQKGIEVPPARKKIKVQLVERRRS
jgi:hypothetical protein